MKKFDTLISNYLYTNKKMDIEGLGNFSLDEGFVLPPDAEKSTFFPLEGIHFEHNTRAETSPELIDFIMQHTGKIRSLVNADFSSYVSEIKQFVNIGKPWAIEGIGTIQKNKEGRYELVPGEALSERVNIHYSNESDEDDKPVRRRKWMVGFFLIVGLITVASGIGFLVYNFFFKNQQNTSVTQTDNRVFTNDDTASLNKPDSIPPPKDTTPVVAPGTYNYKAYFRITKIRATAVTTVDNLALKGIPSQFDSLIIRDTLRYRLFIIKRILPSDSVRIKDSLTDFFGTRVRLERTQ